MIIETTNFRGFQDSSALARSYEETLQHTSCVKLLEETPARFVNQLRNIMGVGDQTKVERARGCRLNIFSSQRKKI